MTLRLAQLGTWHLHATHHVEAARRNEKTDVVVVWDADADAGERFAIDHGLAYQANLDALLSRPDIGGVVVDTATSEHPAVIGAALRAGKHVFSEKVLAIATTDAAELIDLADAHGVVLAVSLPRLADASIRTVKRLVDEGAVGQLTGSRIRYAHHGAVGTPWIPEHFFNREQTGGGALIDLGAHPIYLAMLLHGAAPVSVSAQLSFVTSREVEDNAVAVLEFPGGAFGVAEMSMVASFFAYSLEITGTRGSIALGPAGDAVMLRQGQQGAWVEQQPSVALPDPFDHWVAAVVDGQVDPDHLDTALAVTRIIEAAYESAATGSTVPLQR